MAASSIYTRGRNKNPAKLSGDPNAARNKALFTLMMKTGSWISEAYIARGSR